MAEWLAGKAGIGRISEPERHYGDSPEESTILFDCNDAAYLAWIQGHPDGYVLTSSRSLYPAHTVIHRATCGLIRELMGSAKPGGFTERGYIKVYSESIPPLRDWVYRKRPDGGVRECSRCIKLG